jgi:hypothetical protein
MYWLCRKQNCLLCAYEHDFGGKYIIRIVKTGLTTKKYFIVLSVLILVSDFVKCNHPIGREPVTFIVRCVLMESEHNPERERNKGESLDA